MIDKDFNHTSGFYTMSSQTVIGIIPARFASTRFPGKPLVNIGGKSLLQWTYENAKKIALLSELVVATDDLRIFEHAKTFGAKAFMTSETCQNGTERLAEVIEKEPHYKNASAIVNIQGDEPCICPKGIEKTIELLLSDKEAHMATLATPLLSEKELHSSSIVKCVFDLKSTALYFSRSVIPSLVGHERKEALTHYKHIGLYVYRPDFLLKLQKLSDTPLQKAENLEQLKVLEHGYKIKMALTDKESFGVDHPEDLEKIEQRLCAQNTFL